MLTDKIVLICD